MATDLNPKVSVIMPVYNGELYIGEAIRSVLRQTFTDFELIIINDGSTDRSMEIIKSFSDPRIIIVENPKNSGLSAVRNQGLLSARADFIAFLDCDDIARPNRLKLEADFLTANPEFGIVGSYVKIIDSKGKPTGISWKGFISPEKFPIRALFGNTFTTSSVMLRRSALPAERFREGYAPAEDFELWARILKLWKGWNIPKILTYYRVHSTGTSAVKKTLQQNSIDRIIATGLAELGITPTSDEPAIHRKNYGFTGNDEETAKFLKKRSDWLLKLIEQNRISKHFPEKIFNEVIAEKWLESCDANARLGLKTWKIFRASPLANIGGQPKNCAKRLRLGIKCLISKDKI